MIHPQIVIQSGTTLEQLIVSVLKQPKTACYILWNANSTGPAPQLFDIVDKFWRRVAGKIGGEKAAKDKLKIIISVNLEFDPGLRLSVANQASRVASWGKPGSTIPPTVLDKAQDFWEKQFAKRKPKGRAMSSYGNMTQFSLGSHHQKTLIIVGNRQGTPFLTGYCGMDLAASVAGGHAVWHDGCLRARSDTGFGLLENFTDRWNFEISQLSNTVNYGVASTDELKPDTFFTKTGHPLAGAIEARRTMPVAVEWSQGTWATIQLLARAWFTDILRSYNSLIDGATNWLFLENQYFRHPDVARRLTDHLNATPALRVTIVLPAYSEEIGQRAELPALRDKYVAAKDDATRTALLSRAAPLGLTIDPFNKVTLLMQTRCLSGLVDHPQAKIWIPRRNPRTGLGRPYIHTKLLVTDESALFAGSANVNGRSLDGYADSEINLLLTSAAEIRRIKNSRKWQNEPNDENDPRYLKWSAADPTPTYYATNNLVRYTKRHWEIDQVFSTFPVGREAILDYWETFTKSSQKTRVDTWTPSMTRQELGHLLDELGQLPGIDIQTMDWGTTLIDWTSHLL